MFKINNIKLADKGYFINLSTSQDRLENVEKQINKYNIEGLQRFEALTDEMIQFSCTKSHIEIYRKSLLENVEVLFVGEDDFSIDDVCYRPNKKLDFAESLEKIANDLDTIEWDVILLGCNPKTNLIPITNNLAIVDKSTGAWAYLIKKNAYKYIIENSNYKRDYIAIDDYLPLLNSKGFITLTTIPMLINHASGFISTLQPRGPVNYTSWIQGNYHKFLYDNYPNGNFMQKKIEKELTIVIVGHFIENYLYYLNYLLFSLPTDINKCKFIIHYDDGETKDRNTDIIKLQAYFRDHRDDLNVTLSFGFGGLISSIKKVLTQIKTPYFLFLEHDWVFLKKDNIKFNELIDAFNNHDFINAVWFSKDDNQIRGFEIARDKNDNTTPFILENRVYECDLITSCRWSNNPVVFRLSKMKKWFDEIINNEYVDKLNQSQQNVEEVMIKVYRDTISKNEWETIKDDWGTYLYGNISDGPFVGHTDASKRYQGISKSQPEINGEEYIKNNPLNLFNS
jgi:GR25 family glycosyltransferase involved in LPS biosynthesis